MDYFSKFKRGGTGPAPTSRAKPTAVMQLAKFHKCWNYVHNLYFIEDKKAQVNVQQTPIPQHLRSMVDILVDEEIRLEEDQTGLCMEYLLKNNVLTILVNIAESDFPQGVRGEVMRCVASMINLLDDKFLVHNAVFKPTLKLIRMGTEDSRNDDTYHEDLMELMYVICSKIHGYPDLLNIFFHDRNWMRTPWRKTLTAEQWVEVMKSNASINSPTGTTRRRLFSPAKIATVAGVPAHQRNSIDSASIMSIQDQLSRDAAVAAAYVDSPASTPASPRDPHATPLRSPIQATLPPNTTVTPKPDYEFQLFSYLLRYVHREGKTGDYARTAILFIIELATGALGDYLLQSGSFPAVTAAGVGALFSQLPRVFARDDAGNETEPIDFHRQLDAFTKELEFCQDVLDRCPTPAISQALLANVRRVFLENILWPGLAQCSDTDGSAEAAVTYLDVILRNLRQPAMVDLVLSYLGLPLDTDDDEEGVDKLGENPSAKGVDGDDMDAMDVEKEERPVDGFNLARLVLVQLDSDSESTVTATLNLLETLLTMHCGRTRRLVGGARIKRTTQHRIEDHRRELDLYMSVAGMLNPDLARDDDTFGEGYERYLLDAEAAIETHRLVHEMSGCCPPRYRVDPEAPLPRALNRLLSNYYTNSRRLNLALSGVVAALAHCQYRDIDGWMACLSPPSAGRRGRRQDRTRHRRRLSQLDRHEHYTGFSSDEDPFASDASVSTAFDEDDTEETEGTTEDDPTDTETLASRDGFSSMAPAGSGSPTVATAPGVSPPPALYCTLELLTGRVLELRGRFPEFDTYLRERRKGIRQPQLTIIPRRIDDQSGRQLSDLVDATAMLEEVCKEWLSLVQVRRGVGLDPVAFY
ncbi:Retinoic acid induced 16-like protein-domain-containing protein [Thamnocephalis sphaerospora]|uniref:Retinoic acid induced 16-like protein-domain-containing protein n=1 Tax=Thamnocephalis sphaerospora TaxID=78915 RepID=A0A4P9XT46_9FUNG|nr:Retinoic acid induced 16-like protein-domain-containing protein [Thamnocephalis sphaerospora]|eukprot:RKP09162.1 Retinoic acid induced 16-like protein-domain-containing protein [Thamnocephalis sphaerospora]